MTNNNTDPLANFKDFYLINICPYSNFPISIIGSLLSILNIAVFTRKPMASSMNMIFLNLSCVELAALLINIPSTWHVCVCHKDVHQHVYSWEIIHLGIRVSTYMCFYTSVWQTMMMMIWRYLAIAHPFRERVWCTTKITRVMLIMGYVFGSLLSLTTYISMEIKENPSNHNFTIEYNEESVFFYINFILYGTAMKLIPSVILSVFSFKLIQTLFEVRNRTVKQCQNNSEPEQKISDIKQQTDFTTKMLLGVLVAFLISEVPSGILGLLSLIYGATFRQHYFSPTVHVFNTIRMFTISISFFVYYNLSQQFRKVFRAMFSVGRYHVTNSRESRSGCTSDTPI